MRTFPALFILAATATGTAALADDGRGDTAPLQAVLDADRRVNTTETSAGLLDPGHSVTIPIKARPGRDHISLAAMLIPTNDGFVSVQDVELPYGRHAKTLYAHVYDAGSEPNDELCASIPGPVCGGEGGSPGVPGEGFVHVHGGIHGTGDLNPAARDWRNPVARIVIERALGVAEPEFPDSATHTGRYGLHTRKAAPWRLSYSAKTSAESTRAGGHGCADSYQRRRNSTVTP